MFHRLALIGCGLMGGSLSLAMQRAGLVQHVIGYSPNPATVQEALRRGVLSETAGSAGQAVAHADLVVVAVPVAATGSVLQQIAGHLRPDAIVTDVGSTKQNVIADAEQALGGRVGQFVPAHPIAGKEVAGIAHADPDLYRDRLVILTPARHTRIGPLQHITQLWEALGCKVQTMTPHEHDAAFAAVSHLPHMTAFALMHSILHQDDAADTLAGGDPAMWRDIFLCNREEMLRQTEQLIASLHTFTDAIAAGDGAALHTLISEASEARSQWRMITRDENARL